MRQLERIPSGLESFSFHTSFAVHIDITVVDSQQRNRSRDELLQAAEGAAI